MPTTSHYIHAAGAAYYVGQPPPGMTLVNGTDGKAFNRTVGGMHGEVYKVTSTGDYIIAFTGTSGDGKGFLLDTLSADAQLSVGLRPSVYNYALDFAKEFKEFAESVGIPDSKIFVTGHSLGGGEAQYVASKLGMGGMSFGAPGIPKADISDAPLPFKNYIDYGDPVGNHASDAGNSNFGSIAGVKHYGDVTKIGDSNNGNKLALAKDAVVSSLTSLIPLTTLIAVLGGYGSLASTYHLLGNYALDLNITILGSYTSSSDSIIYGEIEELWARFIKTKFAIGFANGLASSAQHDPLLIDVAGNGIKITPNSVGDKYFDYRGTGIAQGTSWIGEGTGFLAVAAADGLIHNGANLIETFDRLRSFDSNSDGVINSADTDFSKIVVWQDKNQDGVCQLNEVSSLQELGITSISLTTRDALQLNGDTTIIQTALATLHDGSTREIASASFTVSNLYTKDIRNIIISDEANLLPDLKGFGNLPDLRTSMTTASTLKLLVANLVSTGMGDSENFDRALQAVLFRWAGADNFTPESGNAFDGQKLHFIQMVTGNFQGFGFSAESATPVFAGQAELLQTSWNAVFGSMKAGILVQMPDSPFSQWFTVNPYTGIIVPNIQYEDAISAIATAAPSDASRLTYWQNALLIINTSTGDVGQRFDIDHTAIYNNLSAVVPSFFSSEILKSVSTGTLNYVSGSELNGFITGTDSSDLLIASTQNSTLNGFGGGDEFIVGTGLGRTEINEADNSQSAHNILLLKDNPSNITVSGDSEGDVILSLTDGSKIVIDHMMSAPEFAYQLVQGHNGQYLNSSTKWGVQEIRFTDGTSWNLSQVMSKQTTNVYGTSGADVFDGNGLTRYEQGNGGADTFAYNIGYGNLEINEKQSSGTASGSLVFGQGISSSNVKVTGNAGNLILQLPDSSVTIDGMLNSPARGVQNIVFTDGITWSRNDVILMAETGSEYNTDITVALPGAIIDPLGYAHRVTAGGGNSAVIFNRYYGNLEIVQHSQSALDANALRMGTGILSSDVNISGDSSGNVILTVGNNGDRIQIDNMLLGGANGIQVVQFADGTSWGSSYILGQISGSNSGGSYSVYNYNRSSGNINIPVSGYSGIQLDAATDISNVLLQTNSFNDLVIKFRDTPESTLTVSNDLYKAWNGSYSRVQQIFSGNGSVIDITGTVNFTWVGDTLNHVLTGSDMGRNTFEFGPGGDFATAGSVSNKFIFGKGDGHASVALNGNSGNLAMRAGVSQTDIALQVNAAGDLKVIILSTGDSINLLDDVFRAPGGQFVDSRVSDITFADGTSMSLVSPVSTWIGTGISSLQGSNWGSNNFIAGPNSTHIVAGNNSSGGSGSNTISFSEGDGNTTVDMNGGHGILKMPGISKSDVLVQADANYNLRIALRSDPNDTITFTGAISQAGWGWGSTVTDIVFDDGTDMPLGIPFYGQGQPFSFTWIGTNTNKVLTGSDYGSNTFDIGPGGDSVTAGSADNTFLFSRGDGHATADMLRGGTGRLKLDASINPADIMLQTEENGSLIVRIKGDANDSMEFKTDLYPTAWGSDSRMSSIETGNGSVIPVGMTFYGQGTPLALTWQSLPGNNTIIGSGWGSNTFLLGNDAHITGGAGQHGGSIENTYIFSIGSGHTVIDSRGSWATLVMPAGISRNDVIFGADNATASLIITFKGNTTDSVTVQGGLFSAWNGIGSSMKAIHFADGTSMDVGLHDWYQGAPINFTEIASPTNTFLTGSLYGPNTFILAPGDDTVVTGNAFRGGSYQNQIQYHRGDGNALIRVEASLANLKLDSSFTRDDVLVQGDSTNDLIVKFRNDPTDSITFTNVMYSDPWGVLSQMRGITFADNSFLATGIPFWGEGAPLNFTYVGDATHTTLTGSNYATNTFELSGSNNVTAGNNSQGGSGFNTLRFGIGSGNAVVNMNGGYGIIQMGTGITSSDVLVSSTDTNDLKLSLKNNSDSITLLNDVYHRWWGFSSQIYSVHFADGSDMPLGMLNPGIGAPLQFTQIGTTTNTALTGSMYGSNTFVFGPGGDTAIGGNGYQGGSFSNTYLFSAGNGHATINPNSGSLLLKLTAGISETDAVVSSDANHDLIVTAGADSVVAYGGLLASDTVIQFNDGLLWNAPQMQFMAGEPITAGSTVTGTSGNDIIRAVAADQTLVGGGGEDTYLLTLGSGNVTIDNSHVGAASGKLFMNSGMDDQHSWFTQSGDNLLIQQTGSLSTLTVENWFADTAAQISDIHGYNGMHLNSPAVQGLVAAMQAYSAANPTFSVSSASLLPDDTTLRSSVATAWHI